VRLHSIHKGSVKLDGRPLQAAASERALLTEAHPAWVASQDRFGPVTMIRINAQSASTLVAR